MMIFVYIRCLFTESREIQAKMAEARRIHALTFKEHSNLLQQDFRQPNQQLDNRIDSREEEALKQFQRHYPEGLPNPLPQPQFVDSVPPPSNQRRRTKLSVRTVRRKAVSDSHNQFSQQSQSPEHAFQYHEPELIQNDMNGNKRYLDVSLDPHGDHNLHYNWDQSGSSGSSSEN